MSEQYEETTESIASNTGSTDAQKNAISSTYKVRGEDALSNGAGVLGNNTASSGTPIGVEGAVPNNTSGGYGLATPHDALIEGTLECTGPEATFDGNVGIRETSPSNPLHVLLDTNLGGGGIIGAYAVQIDHTASSAECLALKSGADPPSSDDHFIGFFDSTSTLVGAIVGDGAGGINLESYGSDYAEYLPMLDSDEDLEAGDVVGVVDGAVTKRTTDVEQVLVVSENSIVTGNTPGFDDETRVNHEVCAFVGQVPVKVRGTGSQGDLVVASSREDGTGRAVSPSEYRPEEGPIVGRAWEGTDTSDVDQVTVAVGLETGEALTEPIQDNRDRIDALEAENEQLRDAIEAEADRIEVIEDENERLRQRLAAVEDHLEFGAAVDSAPADD
jgi:hypothetical protein